MGRRPPPGGLGDDEIELAARAVLRERLERKGWPFDDAPLNPGGCPKTHGE